MAEKIDIEPTPEKEQAPPFESTFKSAQYDYPFPTVPRAVILMDAMATHAEEEPETMFRSLENIFQMFLEEAVKLQLQTYNYSVPAGADNKTDPKQPKPEEEEEHPKEGVGNHEEEVGIPRREYYTVVSPPIGRGGGYVVHGIHMELGWECTN
jgi:hypothetical protein